MGRDLKGVRRQPLSYLGKVFQEEETQVHAAWEARACFVCGENVAERSVGVE